MTAASSQREKRPPQNIPAAAFFGSLIGCARGLRTPTHNLDTCNVRTLDARARDLVGAQWDVDSLDWKNYGVQNIIDTVCNHKSLDCGSIILCHLGAKYTSQALDEMLTKLQDMGYEIVPVSKLIMTEGYHMDANGMQIKD